MAEGKRYYWLRLHDDFFASKRIKKLRKLAGGDTYTIIYLKMQLKSIKTDGYLELSGIEDSVADEIALDIDESPEDVEVTLNYLISVGLAEQHEGSIFLPYAVENTGSETATTQRVREHRMRRNSQLLQCNTGETQEKQVCNVEIEKEKEPEIEKSKTIKGVFQEFAGDDAELLAALKEFDRMRMSMKAKLTDEAKQRLIKKLEKFPREQWIEILHQSCDKGWKDIYELKQQKGGNYGRKQSVYPDAQKGAGQVQERDPHRLDYLYANLSS